MSLGREETSSTLRRIEMVYGHAKRGHTAAHGLPWVEW